MLMLAVLELVPVFAVTVTVTEPFPVPLEDETVTHVFPPLSAVHVQPDVAVTLTVWLPPPEATVVELGLIENEHDGVEVSTVKQPVP